MTTATEFQAKVSKAGVNMDRLDAIVNGGPLVEVATDGGMVPSVAKVLGDLGDAGAAVTATAADRVQTGLDRAATAADRALADTAAASAVAAGNLFLNTTTGLAGTAEGGYFGVPGTANDFAILYRKVSGAAVEINRYPSKTAAFNRANHTGTQTIATVLGLQTNLDNLAALAALDKVVGNTSDCVSGTGPTWPYYNLTHTRVQYGTPGSPLVYTAAGDGFFNGHMVAAYIGAGHAGGTELVHNLLQVRGAADAGSTNQNQNYAANQNFVSVTVPMGGTALTMAASKGQFFAIGGIGVSYPGATNLRNVTGGEFNVQASAGSSLAYKSGLQITAMPDDKVQGTVYDCGLSISSQVGAVGYRHGILFSQANGQQAVKSDGTILGVVDGGTVANGVNLNGLTITANAYASNGFAVNGSGTITALNFIANTVGSVVRLGNPGAVSSVAIQFASSGVTSGAYDSSITGYGGNGTPGNGGLSADCSTFQPNQDNYASLGSSGHRWTQLWAGTGTINTSDRETKTHIRPLSGSEFDALLDAVGETPIVAFKFKDAVAEKGDAARDHYGIIAQDFGEQLAARGLDPFAGGVLGRDPWMEEAEEEYEVEQQATEILSVEEDQIEVADGRAVSRRVTVEKEVLAFDLIPVFEENGERKIIPAQPARTVIDRKNGESFNFPATDASEVMHQVPRMETVTKTRTVQRRKLDANGEPAWLWSVRYDEFWALRFAWERKMSTFG